MSTYSVFRIGHVVSWKWAQWPQVIEAYSMTVTGAFGSPSAISGIGPGFISSCSIGESSRVGAAVCADAGSTDATAAAAPTTRANTKPAFIILSTSILVRAGGPLDPLEGTSYCR